jgi:hypothetical protein
VTSKLRLELSHHYIGGQVTLGMAGGSCLGNVGGLAVVQVIGSFVLHLAATCKSAGKISVFRTTKSCAL